MTVIRCVRAGCYREEEQTEEMLVLRRVGEPTFNESDTFRYHGTYSTADGCTGLVALDWVNFTEWNRMKVYKGTKRE